MMQKFIHKLPWIIGIFAIIGMTSFLGRLIYKVRSGQGLEYYFTGFGVKMNYIGVLMTLSCIPLALLIGLVIRWWTLRDERDFKRKYGIK